jgi:class 3 adenylate cyclase
MEGSMPLPITPKDTTRKKLSPPIARVAPTSATPLRRRLKSETWESGSVFLMDIAGFTTICSGMSPIKSADMLMRFFKRVDVGLNIYGMVLVDIIGDAYLAINITDIHYEKAVRFAVFCIHAAAKTLIDTDEPSLGTIQVRTAVHSGEMQSIVLESSPFRYTLIGRAIETVRVLEKEGKIGAVHCSKEVIALINNASTQGSAVIRKTEPLKELSLNPTAHTRMDEMQLSITLHNCPIQKESSTLKEIEPLILQENHIQTYLVHERRMLTSPGDVVICPYTLKFVKNSNKFSEVFGFAAHELRNFRMLCGPDTEFAKCVSNFREVYELQRKQFILTRLYTKSGDIAGMMALTLTYQAKASGVNEDGTKWCIDSGVCVLCCKI